MLSSLKSSVRKQDKLSLHKLCFLFFATTFSCHAVALAVPADPDILRHLHNSKDALIVSISEDLNNLNVRLQQARDAKIRPVRSDKQQKSTQKDTRKTYPDRESKQQDIDRICREISDRNLLMSLIEANDLYLIISPFNFNSPFYVGQIGQVRDNQYMRIISIADEDECLVDFKNGLRDDDPKTIWLKGISTTGLVDDDYIRVDPFFIITGTKEYVSVLDVKRTVLVFEPLEIPPNW